MGEELILLDQHAAAERILYEKLLTTSSLNPWVSQALLIPLIITLTPPEYALIISAKDYLYELGFHIDPAGGRSISLREVPVTIPISKSEQVVKDILDDLISVSVGTARKHLLREQIVLAACRASIKAQDHLTRPEMDGLITQLMATQYPYTCPHGRPTMIRFPRSELEKKFKRI
jgi:DNA mismatch repair protein MutL